MAFRPPRVLGSLLRVELATFSSGGSRGSSNQNHRTHQSRDERNRRGTNSCIYDVCRGYRTFLTKTSVNKKVASARAPGWHHYLVKVARYCGFLAYRRPDFPSRARPG